ncbi:hypothetical protein chiPu_0016018 [Chiloscyllium punctatum]|uniref:Immunoglobulin C1-set domain-containing protein n=1 Tax=Chiloscyllium punctatum TaxID=137246 RepID=A0A401T4J5_CHIPU|nr:hypothetical protein [Chiloscyllium punctatum]
MYDSNHEELTPREPWMAESEGPLFWRQKQFRAREVEDHFKYYVPSFMSRTNQTGGHWVLPTSHRDDFVEGLLINETLSTGILPIQDRTYQIRKWIEFDPENQAEYSCRVEHSGLEEKLVVIYGKTDSHC